MLLGTTHQTQLPPDMPLYMKKAGKDMYFLKIADNTLSLSKFADKLDAWGVLHPPHPSVATALLIIMQ